jgi:hypothetical protein
VEQSAAIYSRIVRFVKRASTVLKIRKQNLKHSNTTAVSSVFVVESPSQYFLPLTMKTMMVQNTAEKSAVAEQDYIVGLKQEVGRI